MEPTSDKVAVKLNEFYLFKELHAYEIANILSFSLVKTVPRRTQLFAQFDPISHYYFLLEGQVKLYRTNRYGNEHIMNIAIGGEMFPHIGFFRPKEYPAYAEVVEPSTILVMPVEQFRQVITYYPTIYEKLFILLEDKVINLQSRLEEKTLHPLTDQVLLFLSRLCETFGTFYKEEWLIIQIKLSNRDIAHFIGSTRETINRYLNGLKKEGVIDYTTEGYLLINQKRVTEMVGLL